MASLVSDWPEGKLDHQAQWLLTVRVRALKVYRHLKRTALCQEGTQQRQTKLHVAFSLQCQCNLRVNPYRSSKLTLPNPGTTLVPGVGLGAAPNSLDLRLYT